MRGRLLIFGSVLVPLAIASIVWSAKRPRPNQVHPGTVEIVLLNARGARETDGAQVAIENATSVPGAGFLFIVDAGVHHVRANPEPPPGFNWMPPYSGGEFDLIVAGSPIDEVQRIEVRIGDPDFSAPEAKQPPVSSGPRTILVIVHWPDGGPAQDAVVSYETQTTRTDDFGMTRLLGVDGTSLVFAGKDGLGGQTSIANGESTFFIDLVQRRLQLDVTVLGLAPPTRLAVSSSAMRREFSLRDGGHISLPSIPPFRTVICTGDAAIGACAVVVPDGGTTKVNLVLDAKPTGELTFTAALRGKPLAKPLVQIDGDEHNATEVFSLQPGQHVLLLTADSGEQFEAIVTVEPGKRTDLGELELK